MVLFDGRLSSGRLLLLEEEDTGIPALVVEGIHRSARGKTWLTDRSPR